MLFRGLYFFYHYGEIIIWFGGLSELEKQIKLPKLLFRKSNFKKLAVFPCTGCGLFASLWLGKHLFNVRLFLTDFVGRSDQGGIIQLFRDQFWQPLTFRECSWLNLCLSCLTGKQV